MAINGISTQQVSGISPNAGVSANGGASIEAPPMASRRTTTMTATKWSIWKAARRPESFPICRLNSSSSNPYAPEGA